MHDVVSFNPACKVTCRHVGDKNVIKIHHIHLGHFVGYLFIIDLINARKMEHINIQIRIAQVHTVTCTYDNPFRRKHYTCHANIVLPNLFKRKVTQKRHSPS
jgi:hypothetical protein